MSDQAGTLTLVRSILRRDRLRIALWVAGMSLLVLSSASSIKGLYPTEADLAPAAALVEESAAQIAMNGPPQALDTYGGRIAWEIGAFGFAAVGLMSMFLTGRQTRAEEESGRSELVRAAVVGRDAPITAALLVVAGVNVLLGSIVALGLAGLDLPLTGSVAFGAAMAATGLLFAGVTALAAQVTEHTRGVYGMVGAVLGAAFIVRAAGDAGESWITWLSPLHWGQGVRSFAGERWWPLLLSLVSAVIVVRLAYLLTGHRDLGAGLVQAKPGPASAPRFLSNPLGLALRLQRGTLLGWSVGLFLTGLAYGSVGLEVEDLVGENEQMRDFFAESGGNFTDAFFATTMLMLALMSAGYTIQAVLRLRSEETAYRAEPVLAATVARHEWAGAHVFVAMIGTVVVLGLAGMGAGLSFGLVSGDLAEVPRMLRAALAHVPAVWVFGGLTVAVFGAIPRATVAVWGIFAAIIVLDIFGPLFDLPGWAGNLSPFGHSPQAPLDTITPLPLATLTLVALALAGAGLMSFRRRDLG